MLVLELGWLLAMQSCATWPLQSSKMVSLAGGGVGLFVLGLGFMLFVWFGFWFSFFFRSRLSVQTPVFKFCLYNCVLGRNFYHVISGMLGICVNDSPFTRGVPLVGDGEEWKLYRQ